MKRVALVAERNTALRLSFTPGQVVLEAGTGDEAQAVEVLDASYEFLGDPDEPSDQPEGVRFGPDGLEAAFNPHYLLDGLAAIDSDTARLSFTKPGKAVLITGKPGPDGEHGLPLPADADPPGHLTQRRTAPAAIGHAVTAAGPGQDS